MAHHQRARTCAVVLATDEDRREQTFAFKAYAGAAKDPGDWAAVADRFVGASEEAYLESIGGKEAVAGLPLPIF